MARSSYRRLTFALPAPSEELLVAELWTLGTLGVETRPRPGGEVAVEAYFPAAAERADEAAALTPGGARLLADEALAGRDWLADYRRRARPVAVGERLWVDPAEPRGSAPEPPPGRRLLRLPAREAFGTGSHESTRLAVALMEEIDLDGGRVLDLGTGTGILAFAARLFGANRVVALDLDPNAALLAGENRRLNRLEVAIAAGSVEALSDAARFDVALVNIVPERLAGRLARLPGLLRPGGELVLSGLLAADSPLLEERLGKWGLVCRSRATLAGWTALRLERVA